MLTQSESEQIKKMLLSSPLISVKGHLKLKTDFAKYLLDNKFKIKSIINLDSYPPSEEKLSSNLQYAFLGTATEILMKINLFGINKVLEDDFLMLRGYLVQNDLISKEKDIDWRVLFHKKFCEEIAKIDNPVKQSIRLAHYAEVGRVGKKYTIDLIDDPLIYASLDAMSKRCLEPFKKYLNIDLKKDIFILQPIFGSNKLNVGADSDLIHNDTLWDFKHTKDLCTNSDLAQLKAYQILNFLEGTYQLKNFCIYNTKHNKVIILEN